MKTAFHRCLDELNAAENAWLNNDGNGLYIKWAHDYTCLLQLFLKTTCAEIDAGMIAADTDKAKAILKGLTDDERRDVGGSKEKSR